MNSKKKGNAGERELLAILQEAGFEAVRNNQRYIGGLHNPDIALVVHGLPVHVECKRQENLRLYDAIKQAVSDADGDAFPLVIHRTNRHEWLCSFRLCDGLAWMGGMSNEG